MSELKATLQTETQLQAQHLFDARLRWVSGLTCASFACVGVILILYGGINGISDLWVIGLLCCVLAGIYPVVLLLIFRWRTGLTWHVVNSHSNLFSVSGYLLSAGLVLTIASMLSWFKSLPLIPVLMMVGLSLVVFSAQEWLKGFSQARAQVERQHYGDHWLKLGALSFWNIFLFRIPHERA